MGPVSSMWKAKPQPITLGAVQTQRIAHDIKSMYTERTKKRLSNVNTVLWTSEVS